MSEYDTLRPTATQVAMENLRAHIHTNSSLSSKTIEDHFSRHIRLRDDVEDAAINSWFPNPLLSQMENSHRKARTDDVAMYKKVRSDNIALSHDAAIQIVKMINEDARNLTYDDFK